MNNFDNIYNDMKDLDNKSLKKYILNYDLEKNKTTLETLLFIAYDLHKFELSNDKLEEKIKRQHQNKFRNDLIKRYKSCIVTGKHASICEASHIIPFVECTNEQKYDINNGLLLCSELHKLFDKENALVIQQQLIEKYKDGTVSDLLLALGNIFIFLDPASKYFTNKTLLFRERLKNGYVSESELVNFTPEKILYELYLLPKSQVEKIDEKIQKLIRNFIKKKIYMHLLRHQLVNTEKVKVAQESVVVQ